MIDTSPRRILKAIHASALCPLSFRLYYHFLFVYDFGRSASSTGVSWAVAKKRVIIKKMHPPLHFPHLLILLVSVPKLDLCHTFLSLQNVVKMWQHWIHKKKLTKNPNKTICAWCEFLEEHFCLTKPHRFPSFILIGSLYPPPYPEKAHQHWGGFLKCKKNLKNQRDHKLTDILKAVNHNWNLSICTYMCTVKLF